MSYRELLYGDADKERERLISNLEQKMAQEANPEMRRVYAQAIAVLQEEKSRAIVRV